MKIIDLDILKPESRMVKLGGNDIDVSFLPSGLTFEIDSYMKKLWALSSTPEKMNILAEGGVEAEEAYELSTQICACFCSHKYPEMTSDWFRDNCTGEQITFFTQEIRGALTRAYNTGESNAKNVPKARKKKT